MVRCWCVRGRATCWHSRLILAPSMEPALAADEGHRAMPGNLEVLAMSEPAAQKCLFM